MKTKYIKVSVSERLPEAERHVLAFWNTGESGTVVINENGYWYSFEAQSECDQPDFWLEPVPDREDEMREMLKEARTIIARMKRSMLVHPDHEEGNEFDDLTTSAQDMENQIGEFLTS